MGFRTIKPSIINEVEMMSNTAGSGENLTSGQFGRKLGIRDKIGSNYSLSPRMICVYLRTDTLIGGLKPKTGREQIPL